MGNDITLRKTREMIVASRMEHALTWARILEASSQFDLSWSRSWGIEMAARSYFGKDSKALSAVEGALRQRSPKGPNYFNPTTTLSGASASATCWAA